jgi:hypothetical protein
MMELSIMKLPALGFSVLLAGAVFALPATAHVLDFSTTLTGPNEAPPNASPGTGTAFVSLDTDLATLHVVVDFKDLIGTTTASHIHCCTDVAGAGTASVATQLPTFPDFPLGVTSGHFDKTFDLTQASSYNTGFINNHGGTVGTAFNALIAGLNEGKAYLNIHTSEFPGGEIRGFLTAVPEPEAYALLAIGLAATAAWSRRRRNV